VELDDKNETVYLKEKGMQLDLGAIAKGFITDETVSYFKKHGVTTAIIDLGGNVFVMGHSPRGEDTPWTVGIQDPNKARNTVIGYVYGKNKSFVTSGIYERFLEVDGKKYHHILSPKTGYPYENDLAGVTIVTDKSIDGDGLSTTLFALGRTAGTKFIENMKDTEAIFVTKDDKVYTTSGLKDFKLEDESGYTMGK
jgi:thiamine biosynthesis lipoprotein